MNFTSKENRINSAKIFGRDELQRAIDFQGLRRPSMGNYVIRIYALYRMCESRGNDDGEARWPFGKARWMPGSYLWDYDAMLASAA